MKRLIPILILMATACSPHVKDSTDNGLNLADFLSGDTADCTEAIQAAIDSCSRSGARLTVPKGTYICGTLYLRDSVELHLEEGATLLGTDDPKAYKAFIPEHDLSRYDSGEGTQNSNSTKDAEWMRAFIIADRVKNVSITGKGTIDGRHVFNPDGEENMRGPHTIVVAEAENFMMDGVTVTRSANYAVLGYALENASFKNLHITEGWDGIHIRGGKNIRITDCLFETGDDSIAGGYWENMLIAGCGINTSCNGIRMIMPSDGVEVRDCRFFGPGNYPHRTSGEARRNNMLFGISLEPGAWGKASGDMKRIYLHDLTMEDLSSAISTSVREGSRGMDLTMENITATGLKGSTSPVVSWNDLGFESIIVKNCSFTH